MFIPILTIAEVRALVGNAARPLAEAFDALLPTIRAAVEPIARKFVDAFDNSGPGAQPPEDKESRHDG